MCWKTLKHPIEKVADKNIEVFKIIRVNNTPYYHPHGTPYTKGVICPKVKMAHSQNIYEESFLFKEKLYTIYEGYHSYSKEKLYATVCFFKGSGIQNSCHPLYGYQSPNDSCIEKYIKIYKKEKNLLINQYFETKDGFIKLADFIIPKGTKYYENEFGEIVSETIKMI